MGEEIDVLKEMKIMEKYFLDIDEDIDDEDFLEDEDDEEDFIEVDDYLEALERVKSRKDYNDIKYLMALFNDRTNVPEVQWSLVHAVESYCGIFEKEIVMKAFLEAIPSVYPKAKDWVLMLVRRKLNSEKYADLFISVVNNCDDEIKVLLKEVAIRIKEDKIDNFAAGGVRYPENVEKLLAILN